MIQWCKTKLVRKLPISLSEIEANMWLLTSLKPPRRQNFPRSARINKYRDNIIEKIRARSVPPAKRQIFETAASKIPKAVLHRGRFPACSRHVAATCNKAAIRERRVTSHVMNVEQKDEISTRYRSGEARNAAAYEISRLSRGPADKGGAFQRRYFDEGTPHRAAGSTTFESRPGG